MFNKYNTTHYHQGLWYYEFTADCSFAVKVNKFLEKIYSAA